MALEPRPWQQFGAALGGLAAQHAPAAAEIL